MLRVRGLAKAYAGPRRRTVLKAIDLDLAAGETIAVMGESGVGKSTLLNLLAGLDRPDAGSIEIDAVDLDTLDDDARTRLRRAKIGFVFQAFHVLPYLDVRQNVALPLALNGLGAEESRARADAMLARVGLAGRESASPRELSGGELQRVAIARALVHRPALLLADEPTGNLDPETARDVLRVLQSEVKAQRAAAVLVTHSLAAAHAADRVLVLTPEGLHERDVRERDASAR